MLGFFHHSHTHTHIFIHYNRYTIVVNVMRVFKGIYFWFIVYNSFLYFFEQRIFWRRRHEQTMMVYWCCGPFPNQVVYHNEIAHFVYAIQESKQWFFFSLSKGLVCLMMMMMIMYMTSCVNVPYTDRKQSEWETKKNNPTDRPTLFWRQWHQQKKNG